MTPIIVRFLPSWQNSSNLAGLLQPLAACSDLSLTHLLKIKVSIEILIAEVELNFMVHKVDISVEPF